MDFLYQIQSKILKKKSTENINLIKIIRNFKNLNDLGGIWFVNNDGGIENFLKQELWKPLTVFEMSIRMVLLLCEVKIDPWKE